MALTTQQKKGAARWWFRRVFRDQGLPASAHWGDLSAAFDEADAWVDAKPTAAPASNAASFSSAISASFKTKLTDAGITLAPAMAYLFSALAQARAGAFG